MNNQWRDNAHRTVVWADGTYDTQRICDGCGSPICETPVHTDRYRTIGCDDIGLDEENLQESVYWDWMQARQPLGGKLNAFGEKEVKEFYTANPDGLAGDVEHGSGISHREHDLMRNAFDKLTEIQKRVWQMVMREQLSEVKVAEILNTSKQNVSQHLARAKAVVVECLRQSQDA